MPPYNLMRHSIDVYRPTIGQDNTSQAITGYTQVYSGIPCFIQPASTEMIYFYEQRGTSISHTIYTTSTPDTFIREDVFVDVNGYEYHLVADPLNALQSGIYLELPCQQYPEGGRLRLNMDAY